MRLILDGSFKVVGTVPGPSHISNRDYSDFNTSQAHIKLKTAWLLLETVGSVGSSLRHSMGDCLSSEITKFYSQSYQILGPGTGLFPCPEA